jgi:hypothetical protein
MKPKRHADRDEEMRPEYDFSNAVRGKYYERYRRGVTIHVAGSERTSVTLLFKDSGTLDAAQVGELLFLLRGAYAAGLEAFTAPTGRSGGHTQDQVAAQLRAYTRQLDVDGINALFSRDLGAHALVTRSITYRSPLQVKLSGTSEGLIAAILLAGGDPGQLPAQASSVNLPSVSEVSEALREALVPSVKAPLGYGIRSRRLKLSKEELNELLRHHPATQNRGGFQRFLLGLQSRVNRVSGEIALSESDMNMILRHGRNPRRGGWQASIRKIFGRHFDFDAA